MKVEPREDSTRRACMQPAQRPARERSKSSFSLEATAREYTGERTREEGKRSRRGVRPVEIRRRAAMRGKARARGLQGPCFSCIEVQTATALLGFTALSSNSTCWILPSLSTTKVVRRAHS